MAHFWIIYDEISVPLSIPILVSVLASALVISNIVAAVSLCLKGSEATLVLFSVVNFRLLRYSKARAIGKSVFATMLKSDSKTKKGPSSIFYTLSMLSLAYSFLIIIMIIVGFIGAADWGEEIAVAGIGLFAIELGLLITTLVERMVPNFKIKAIKTRVSIEF